MARCVLLLLLVTIVQLTGLHVHAPAHAQTDARAKAETHFKAAQEAIKKDDFPTAYAQLQDCLKHRPADAQVLLLLARTATQQRMYAEAKNWLAEYQKNDGDKEQVALEEWLRDVEQGDLEKHRRKIEDKLKINGPEKELVYEAVCRACMDLSLYDRAVFEEGQIYLRYWLKFNPKRIRAWLWFANSGPEENVDLGVAMALQLDPSNVEAQVIYVGFHIYEAQPTKVLERLKKIPESRLNSLVALQTLAGVYLKCGMPEEAERIFPRMDAIQKDALDTMLLRGRAALQLEKLEVAEKWFGRCIAMEKHHPEALDCYALALRSLNKDKELARCEEAIRLIAEKMKVVSNYKKRLTEKGQPDPALCCKLGQAYLNLSMEKGGLHLLNKALALDPDHAESHEALAKFYRAKNEIELAEKHEMYVKKK